MTHEQLLAPYRLSGKESGCQPGSESGLSEFYLHPLCKLV
ncbi:hypothetical protein [Pseudomonas sp. 31 R 17]|nr:hypothetical protein [Pseudomonas sp. 31 R 17]